MTDQRSISIVRTGSANLASVVGACRRLGLAPVLTDDPGHIEHAPLLVLPGVGAFGAAMQTLAERGLDAALRRRIDAERPLLAICLGLQLLARESEESPRVAGLGVIDATVTRFTDAPRVPQMGWNTIAPTPGADVLRVGHAYYANSYRLAHLPPGWQGATSDHAGPFVAALERGTLLACQFHPELSGQFGHDLLCRWLARCGVTVHITGEAAPC